MPEQRARGGASGGAEAAPWCEGGAAREVARGQAAQRVGGRDLQPGGAGYELNFEYCKFESLPGGVGGLRALTSLKLNNTGLTTLLAEVGGLLALTSLDLSYTKLTTLPAEVGGLRALTSLNISGTGLKLLPAEVGGLLKLTSLDLMSTLLTTLPTEVGGLRALTSLVLTFCRALTTLPAEVGRLRALTSLKLNNTGLTTLPAEVGGLLALTSLSISGTGLKTLPAEVGGLRALTSLDLRDCDLLTSPPKEIHDDRLAVKSHLLTSFAKQWTDNDQAPQRLHEYPGMLHALAEDPSAANFLRALLEADPTLANITEGDKLGRNPIEHACPECNLAMRAALCLLGRYDIDDGPPLHFSTTSAVVQADDIGSTDVTSGTNAKPPRRALKAMRKAEQVLAELNGRDGLDPKYTRWRA